MRSVPASPYSLVVLAIALQLAPAAPAAVFADGQVHVIDAANGLRYEGLLVSTYSGLPPTTVRLVDGGEVGTGGGFDLRAVANSIVIISGGEVGDDILLEDSASLSMSGGQANGSIFLVDDTVASVSGGTARAGIEAADRAQLDISGGSFAESIFGGTSVLNGSARATITGGEFHRNFTFTGDCYATISGGIFDALLYMEGSAAVEISGGTFTNELWAVGSAQIEISGYAFNLPFGSVLPTSGTLTGIFADGTPIELPFFRAPTATIVLVRSQPSPHVRSTKTDVLLADVDGDGRADPGDVLRYEVLISNGGTADAEGVSLSDLPDPSSSLVPGSVRASQGSVVVGNGPGDASVQVDIGTLTAGGGSAEIAFEVLVDDPFPSGILTIGNQGRVSGRDFDPVVTDDPSTAALRDPTLTQIANTELDVCARDLGQCEGDLAQCRFVPPFEDADGDGEYDGTDLCPGTMPGADVDTAGCSLIQFCRAIDASRARDRRTCRISDWNNDEPGGNPRDCEYDRGRGLCVPAVESAPQERHH